ncbi:MAG TPA: hypothetical protein VMV29_15370 [Ktedonobacterales bacterium]|nr:hypothetical protein [Ktedonobacterales bacterium]
MRKVLGSTIFVVVVALIVAGVAYSLNSLARLPGTYTGVKSGTGAVTIHEDIFPFNTCTSDPTNANVDAPFVALHPRYAQCSSSKDNYNWVTYSDPTISAPVNTHVTMEIYNYDSATPILNNYYTEPQGITGGVMTVLFPKQDAKGNLLTSATDSGVGTQTVPVVPGSCQKNASSCFAEYDSIGAPADPKNPFSFTYGPGTNDPATLSVDPNAVSHTFAIHGIASSVSNAQPYLYISVPIMGAQPATVTDPSGNVTTSATDGNPTPPPADAAGMSAAPIITTFSFTTPSQPGSYVWQCFDPCGANFNGFGGPMSTKGYMSGTFTVTAS